MTEKTLQEPMLVMVKSRFLYMAIIFCGALIFRLAGINWGLPERIDIHPDEQINVIRHVMGIIERLENIANHKASFSLKAVDPVFLNYPSFFMYLTSGAFLLLHKVFALAASTANVILVGRYISAFFGAATCVAVFLLTEEMGGGIVGAILAGAWMALFPLHVWESHIAVTDVLMSFWTVLTLLASLRLLRTGLWRDYIFAGVTLGLAVGSKYTAALTVVAVVAAALFSGRPLQHTFRGLCVAALMALMSFFVVAPFSLLRLDDLLNAMQFEHQHTLSHHYGFSLPALGPQYHRYIYQLCAAWPFSLGFALYGCAIAGLIVNMTCIDRRRLVLFLFFAVFWGITGSWNFTPLRYYLPLLIVMIVFASLWQAKWLRSPTAWRQWCALVVIVGTLGYTTVFTYQTDSRFWHETRLSAAAWLNQYAQEKGRGQSLLNIGIKQYLALPQAGDFSIEDYTTEEKFIGGIPEHYNLIQITSLNYARAYRHGYPTFLIYNRIRSGQGKYSLVKRFETEFINKKIYEKLDPMFGGYFIAPTIEFYAQK